MHIHEPTFTPQVIFSQLTDDDLPPTVKYPETEEEPVTVRHVRKDVHRDEEEGKHS